ncbi:MAG TPA: hypothetical protein VGS08_00555 [Candidatus Saccharimonadales bacterium]|nr:hypothetical protein [Candidatus Saccharimonadales bacterium]
MYQSQDREGNVTIQLSEAAREASDRIAEHYLSFSISRAWKVWDRTRTLSLDDLIGAACTGLVVGIRNYAQKKGHESFPDYLEYVLKGFLGKEVDAQKYHTNQLSGWQQDIIRGYKRLVSEEPTITDVTTKEYRGKAAETLGVYVSDIVVTESVVAPPLFYEGIGALEEDNVPFLDTVQLPSLEAG